MKDLMLDLETLGPSPDGVVAQIGACYFDRNTGEIGEELSITIDPKDEEREGFKLNADTVLWWLKQSDEARKAVFNKDYPQFSAPAWNSFAQFAQNAEAIWSHSTFDFVIAKYHLMKFGPRLSYQIHYRTARDIRTLTDLAQLDPAAKSERKGIHHNALDDAKFQVSYCVAAFNIIKERMKA